VGEFDRADGNALHLLPLIIPYYFTWLIVSTYVCFDPTLSDSQVGRVRKKIVIHPLFQSGVGTLRLSRSGFTGSTHLTASRQRKISIS
jgi:hypothetical protein